MKIRKVLSAIIFLATGSQVEANVKELRAGVMRHDVKSGLRHHYERGEDINAEVLFNEIHNRFFNCILNPMIHAGTHVNTNGATSQIYAGLTWRIDMLNPVFLELSFGGSANNGRTSKQSSKRNALGSNVMFREGASVGWQINAIHSLSLLLDHTSNASLAKKNPGITNIGLRYGFRL